MAGNTNLHAMAWRNVWRNRRRTLLTLSGVAFGMLLAILFTGMGDSTYGKMVDLAARTGSGHVTIQHPEYQETPSLKKTVRATTRLIDEVSTEAHVQKVVPRVGGATMLATARNSFGAFFIAVDPDMEDEDTLSLLESISEGEMLEGPHDPGIVLGRVLADNLSTKLGAKVVFTLTDKDGEIVSGLARVKGIVKTGAPAIDGGICLLSIGMVRETLGYEPDEATQVAVFLDDNAFTADVAKSLAARDDATRVALPWRETQPDLAAYIATDSAGIVVFEVIIMVLLAAGIFNALFVSVMERLREFGIMLAVGFSPAQLFGLVMWESLWLALTGIFAAALVTVGPYYYFNTQGIDISSMMPQGTEVSGVAIDPVLYVDILPAKLLTICIVVVVATLCAGIYPAWKAGRVAPVETIKLV